MVKMRTTRRMSCRGGWRLTAVAAALLAVVGVAGGSASAAVANWTEQAPATSPSTDILNAAMAYDAATGTVVLFGGLIHGTVLRDTWTWNGTTWTKQAPAARPPARYQASMAYDAATGTDVLFGGIGNPHALSDTWTWNGTTWTKQAPATHPSPRRLASMAYDTATGTD